MKKHMRLIDESALPNKNLRFDLFEAGAEVLQGSGYQAIGIDHFAKANDPLSKAAEGGRLKRNFQGYTTDAADVLLGVGASSIGKLPQGYIQNHPDMPLYREALLRGQLPVKKYCTFSKDDLLRAALIEELMCNFSLDIERLCSQYNVPSSYFDQELEELDTYIAQGLCALEGRIITVSPNARPAARLIASIFDVYFNAAMQQRHSKAV